MITLHFVKYCAVIDNCLVTRLGNFQLSVSVRSLVLSLLPDTHFPTLDHSQVAAWEHG